jgi:ribonucleoside-diphosphate reductase beta chain
VEMRALGQPHQQFTSVSNKGIDYESPSYRLYEKAKKFGIWNPLDIDLTQDKRDFESLSDSEKKMIIRLVSYFAAGEESVTLDLVPLLSAMGRLNHLEDEMYLTTFLFEEAKHTEFFARWIDEIGIRNDLDELHGENYKKIFYDELPKAMDRLFDDCSPEAIVNASTTYNMIVEGTLAESGYYGFRRALKERNLMPGLLKGIDYINRDEGRHIGFGIYLISRYITEDPKIYDVCMNRMNELLPIAIGVTTELMPDDEPFGISTKEISDYAIKQFNARVSQIQKAKEQSRNELVKETIRAFETI